MTLPFLTSNKAFLSSLYAFLMGAILSITGISVAFSQQYSKTAHGFKNNDFKSEDFISDGFKGDSKKNPVFEIRDAGGEIAYESPEQDTTLKRKNSLDLAASNSFLDDIKTRPYLLGDWNGQRSILEKEGVTFKLNYTSEIAHNKSGGTRKNLTRNADQWTFGTTLDFEKLMGWKGASFKYTMTSRTGNNLSSDANLGTNQQVQEIYGTGQTWRLTDFWLEQKLWDDFFAIKLGRLGVGEDFFAFSCDFQNLSFCGSAPGNILSYWHNWPVSQWASLVKLKFSDEYYWQIAAYQVNSRYPETDWATHHGWWVNNPSGTQGALFPTEFAWLPKIGDMPGKYKLGAWWTNANADDLYLNDEHESIAEYGGDSLKRKHQYGQYLNLQQQIEGTPDKQGTSLFFNYTQADRNTSKTDRQISIGGFYQAPFDRWNDKIGLAYGLTHASSRYASYQKEYNIKNPQNSSTVLRGYEYTTEIFYQWSPIQSIKLSPNLQWVRHPGATAKRPDVIVIGLKSSVDF